MGTTGVCWAEAEAWGVWDSGSQEAREPRSKSKPFRAHAPQEQGRHMRKPEHRSHVKSSRKHIIRLRLPCTHPGRCLSQGIGQGPAVHHGGFPAEAQRLWISRRSIQPPHPCPSRIKTHPALASYRCMALPVPCCACAMWDEGVELPGSSGLASDRPLRTRFRASPCPDHFCSLHRGGRGRVERASTESGISGIFG